MKTEFNGKCRVQRKKHWILVSERRKTFKNLKFKGYEIGSLNIYTFSMCGKPILPCVKQNYKQVDQIFSREDFVS